MIEKVKLFLKAYNKKGKETRIVGGAVRNFLLNEKINDVDFVTTIKPNEVMKIAYKNQWQPIPTGIKYGTVTVMVDDIPFQITTCRSDSEPDGRRAKVTFGKSFEADAKRRDFTMNSLMLDKDLNLQDPLNARQDVLDKRVRFIGDAATRIQEDYVRILRFFRFSSLYGLTDNEGLQACITHQKGLEILSKERVWMEFYKILKSPAPQEVLHVMSNAGILLQLTGGVFEIPRTLPDDAILRLALMAVKTNEDAVRLHLKFKLPNGVFRRLESVSDGWVKAENLTQKIAKILLYENGTRGFLDRLTLAEHRFQQDYSELKRLPEKWQPPLFPITGEMVMAKGFTGEEVGAELKRLKAEWLQTL